jgi:hypothetical protein
MKRIYTTKNHLNEMVAIQFQTGTKNSKTGNGVQIAILPWSWITTGKMAMKDDSSVCFDCPHSQRANGTCYVRKGQSNMGLMSKVASLHNAYIKGNLEVLDIAEAAVLEKDNCRNKYVRFGQYGEPVLLGESVVSQLAQVASNWTGYTHLWFLTQYAWASKYFMASVETQPLRNKAESKGFRSFLATYDDTQIENSVTCPASKEAGRKVTCDRCGLCKGTSIGAKSVNIKIH